MLHAEQTVDSFRVYASATPAAESAGYRAAAVVLRLGNHGLPVEVVFRDDELDDRRLWREPGAAVRFALEVGEAAAKNFSVLGAATARSNSRRVMCPAAGRLTAD